MTHKQLNILLVGVLAVNIIFTANMYYKNQRIFEFLSDEQIASSQQREELLDCHMVTELLSNNIKAQYAFEDYQLSDCELLDAEGSRTHLSALFNKNEYKLIFKFSTQNCASCIESELENIVNVAKEIGKEHIVILTEGDGLRQVSAFMVERNVKISTFLICEKIGVLEKYNIPFVFVMNKDLQVRMLYIPIKELQGFSEQYYYSSVIPRFFVEN